MGNDSEAEHIRLRIVRPPIFGRVRNDFRCDIAHRPTAFEHLKRYLLGHDERQPQINNLGSFAEQVDDNVLRLEIPVDNISAVSIGKGNEDTFHERLAGFE